MTKVQHDLLMSIIQDAAFYVDCETDIGYRIIYHENALHNDEPIEESYFMVQDENDTYSEEFMIYLKDVDIKNSMFYKLQLMDVPEELEFWMNQKECA